MNNPSQIERAVMRRIHIIRAVKPLLSGGTLSALILIVALWGIGREVWVAQVFHNAPANLMDLPQFYIAALGHTRIIVQAFTLLTLASLVYLAREVARAFTSFFTLARA